MSNSKYYKQGYDAFYIGYTINQNPFSLNSDNGHNWQLGFKAAEYEMEYSDKELEFDDNI